MKFVIFTIISLALLNAHEGMHKMENDTQKEHASHSHAHDEEKQYGLSGHIGAFNKTNLGKTQDNYDVFSASMSLAHNIQETLFFGLGIYAMTPLYEYPKHNADEYVQKKFVTNKAYVKYVAKNFFSISAGRYHEDRDWLRHYIQGVGIDMQYSSLKIWANWVNEQAHANRQHVTDFDTYKNAYNGEFLWAGGFEIEVPYFAVEPYYYAVNNYFWSVGGKLESQLKNNNGWGYHTTLHYAYLNDKTNNAAFDHADDHLHDHLHEHSSLNGNSSIVWLDQEIKYGFDNGSLLFGGGYIKVWKSYFELANIGNRSRFDTDSEQGYDVIEPGGVDNGINTSNMFNANTGTLYGFVGAEINDVALMLLGRNSTGGGKRQDAYSLGFRWNVILGVSIGGVGTYMVENKRNLSFLKGYVEFKI